jgi:hypothetical protein
MPENYGSQASDVIYFEHNMKAIESARSVWIISYFYDMNTRDIKWVKEFLDSNI